MRDNSDSLGLVQLQVCHKNLCDLHGFKQIHLICCLFPSFYGLCVAIVGRFVRANISGSSGLINLRHIATCLVL